MIGCGGGTLATLLVRGGVQVTVVDNNPNSFFLAHSYFQMPAQVNCVVSDGADYLDVTGELYDAVVLDAYNGSRIPGHLRSERFLKLVKRRLDRSEEIFFANVYVHHDFDLTADRMLHTAGTLRPEAALLDTRGRSSCNAIVLAGAINNVELPRLVVRPTSRIFGIELDLSSLKFRQGRLGNDYAAVDKFRRLATSQDMQDRD